MKRTLSIFLLFVVLSSGESLPQAVRVYDLAEIPKATLNRALIVASRLLEKLEVLPVWESGSSDSLEARTTDFSVQTSPADRRPDKRQYLVVTITIGPPEKVKPGLTGYALPFAKTGTHATVFYDRVRRLHPDFEVGPDTGTLLGASIAHELGHVLMGSVRHSSMGLMKSQWGAKEFLLLARDQLQFTSAGKIRIR